MLRKFEPADLNRVMEIWLAANLEAHSFVDPDYWRENLETVRQILPQAEVYVYTSEDSQEILGFIGLEGDYIAGIFVDGGARSQGIGRQLLDFAKSRHDRLSLQVYRQNKRALRFYQRENFQIGSSAIAADTGAEELKMLWQV